MLIYYYNSYCFLVRWNKYVWSYIMLFNRSLILRRGKGIELFILTVISRYDDLTNSTVFIIMVRSVISFTIFLTIIYLNWIFELHSFNIHVWWLHTNQQMFKPLGFCIPALTHWMFISTFNAFLLTFSLDTFIILLTNW